MCGGIKKRVREEQYREYVRVEQNSASEVAMNVYNKYRNPPADAVYIGRGSPFGNPFVIGKDGDRDEVCDKFERFIMRKPVLIARIKRVLRGKDLICFCAPKRCHGETLLRIANS